MNKKKLEEKQQISPKGTEEMWLWSNKNQKQIKQKEVKAKGIYDRRKY